jgi:peptide/nickel transport system permease protein
MAYARLTNSRVLGLKHTEFIEAARAMGASGGRIILRHLIPNSVSPAIVLAARDIGGMVLMQATLTFIGIGGGSEWGEILATGRRWIIAPGGNPLTYWWVFVPVTLALVIFGIGWNLLGDGLNDWLDPQSH